MKKTRFVLSALALIALVSCGGGQSSSSPAQSSSQATTSSQGGDSSAASSDSQGGGGSSSDSSSSSQGGGGSSATSSDSQGGGGSSSDSSSSSAPAEDPLDPVAHRIEVDMTKPATPIVHPDISDEQGKSILTRFISEGYADAFYENANKVTNFSEIINALGFSYQDLSAIADLYDFLHKVDGMDEDVTATQFIAQFSEVLSKAMSGFKAEKFALSGMNQVEIHPMVFTTPRVLRSYGFSSMEALDQAIKAAPASAKAGLETLRTYANNLMQETKLTIKASDLLKLGYLLEGFLKAAIQQEADFVYYCLLGMTGQLYMGSSKAPEGSARKKLYDLSEKYSDPAAIVSAVSNILRALDLNGASYEAIIDLLKTYVETTIDVEGGAMEDSVFELTQIKAALKIYDDLRDLIDGNDLKVLFEFLFRLGAEYTPEFEKQIREAEDMYAPIIEKFDSLYGRLTSTQKAAISRLFQVAGLDLDEVLEGLRGLANLPEDKKVSDVLMTVFKPLIDKYEPQFGSRPFSLYGGRGYYDLPNAIVYLEGETPTAAEIADRIEFYDSKHHYTVRPARVELVGQPKGSYLKRQEVKAYVSDGKDTYEYLVSFGYFCLPASLGNYQAIAANSTTLGALPLYSEAVRSKLASTAFSRKGYASKYDASKHEIAHESVAFTYTYADLTWTKGVHTITLSASIDPNIKADFSYQIYEEADVKYAASYLEKQPSGIGISNGTILLTRAPKAGEKVILQLQGYVEDAIDSSNGRYRLGAYRRVYIDLPEIAAGEEKEVTVDGSKVKFYRFAESELIDKSVEFYISNKNYFYDEKGSSRLYNLQETDTVETISRYGYVYEAYRHDDYYYNRSTQIQNDDIRLLDLNVTGEKDKVRELTLEYQGYSKKVRYAVVSDEAISLKNTEEVLLASLSETGNVSFRYCATLIDGEIAKDFFYDYSLSIDTDDFTYRSEDTSVGKHVYRGDYNGIPVVYAYEIIDFTQVTIEAGKYSHAQYGGTQSNPYVLLAPQSYVAKYGEHILDEWSVSVPEASVDLNPGVHTFAAKRDVYGHELSYNVEYETASDVGVDFQQASDDVFVVKGQATSVYVYLMMNYTAGGVKYASQVGSSSVAISAEHTATKGLHENEEITIGSGESATKVKVTYYVYEESDVTTTISNIRQDGEVGPTSTTVNFVYDKTVTIALEGGKTRSMSGSNYQVYEIPETERTLGKHTAKLSIAGTVYDAEYVISPVTAPTMEVNDISFGGQYGNAVAVGEELQINSFYVNTYYSDKGYSSSQRIYDNFDVVADTSAVTNGYAAGYIIYQGQAFRFEYLVYGQDAQFGFIKDEDKGGQDTRYYMYGELRAGQTYNWYDYGFDSIATGGTTYVLGGTKTYNHNVTLGESDLTIGKHSFKDGVHTGGDYEVLGFTDERVHVKNIKLNGQKAAYEVGTGVNFSLEIQYTWGNEDYVHSMYVNRDKLQIEGFDISASTSGQTKTAKVTFGDLVYTFDYIAYEKSEIDESTFTYGFELEQKYYVETSQVGSYFYGYFNIYATIGETQVLISQDYAQAYVQKPDMSVGEHEVTCTRNGVTAKGSYEVLSMDDERLVWDRAYITDVPDKSPVLVEKDSNKVNIRVVGLYMVDADGSEHYFNNDTVFLSPKASCVQGLDVSTSTHGEAKSAKYVGMYDTRTFTYIVYDQSEVHDDIRQGRDIYLLAGTDSYSIYLYFNYERYILDAAGNKYTFFQSGADANVEGYTEAAGGFTEDITGKVEVNFYIDGQYVPKEVTYLIHVVAEEDCEVKAVLSWNSDGTFYQNVQYEDRAVYGGTLYYYYTPEGTPSAAGEETPSILITQKYCDFEGKNYVVSIDTAQAGEIVKTATFDGITFTYEYSVVEVPAIQYLRVVVLDPFTGEWKEMRDGETFTGKTDYFYFRIESNWACAKLDYDTLNSENDGSIGNPEEWVNWSIAEEENHEVTLKFTNELYADWSFTFTYQSANEEPETYSLWIAPTNWGEDGPKTGWSPIGNGYYESNNQGRDDTWVLFFVDFAANGTFSFSYDVDAEEGYDCLIIYLNDSYYCELSGSGVLDIEAESGSYITFYFVKDGGVSEGRDSAIVGDFVFVPQENED